MIVRAVGAVLRWTLTSLLMISATAAVASANRIAIFIVRSEIR